MKRKQKADTTSRELTIGRYRMMLHTHIPILCFDLSTNECFFFANFLLMPLHGSLLLLTLFLGSNDSFSSFFPHLHVAPHYQNRQEDKVVQMYETMMTRHSTMIVGPTGGGKTVVINTLIKAQTYMGLPTKCITLNPKVSSNHATR